MAAKITKPPMAHCPNPDPVAVFHPRPNSSTTQTRAATSKSQSALLAEQAQKAYNHRATAGRSSDDLDNRSDTTSASHSKPASSTDLRHAAVQSPTFSRASDLERGRAGSGQGSVISQTSNAYGTTANQRLTKDSSQSITATTYTQLHSPYAGHSVAGWSAEADKPVNDYAISILLWLSIFDPFYSLLGAIYTLIAALIVTLLSPLQLCNKKHSPGLLTIAFLSPLAIKHLDLLHIDLTHFDSPQFRASKLVLVYLLAPILSIGIAIATWVAASFWIFALMMGNPDGTERGDDGQNAVLKVRDWWAKWLTMSIS